MLSEEANPKWCILYDYVYRTFLKWQNFKIENRFSGCEWLETWGEGKGVDMTIKVILLVVELFVAISGFAITLLCKMLPLEKAGQKIHLYTLSIVFLQLNENL